MWRRWWRWWRRQRKRRQRQWRRRQWRRQPAPARVRQPAVPAADRRRDLSTSRPTAPTPPRERWPPPSAPWRRPRTSPAAATSSTCATASTARPRDFNAVGAAGNPVVFMAYPGEHPILDGNGQGLGERDSVLQLYEPQHVVVSGLEIRNAPGRGLQIIDGDDVVIRDCTIHDVGVQGARPQRHQPHRREQRHLQRRHEQRALHRQQRLGGRRDHAAVRRRLAPAQHHLPRQPRPRRVGRVHHRRCTPKA